RITAQLVRAPTDQHVWAESYERDLRDILSLQNEVARAIADEIRVKLTPQERAYLGAARPVDPDAYQLYLQGRYRWHLFTAEGWKKSIEYFEQAISKDPSCALAYAGMAASYNVLSLYSDLPPQESYSKAMMAARQALELEE